MREFRHLTFTDRLQIEAWERIGTPAKIIAEELGVHVSTIYRELKRGRYDRLNSDLTMINRYSPDIAEKKYQANLRAKGAELKIGNDHEFAEYVEYKIAVEKYSPGAVLGEIKRKSIKFNTSISKTTLYRYIDQGVFLSVTNKDLPVKRNKDKPKYKRVKASRPPAGRSIEKRPEEILTREEFGNWEMDSVVGKQGTKKILLVLTERKTRLEIIRLLKDKTAKSVVEAIDSIEEEMGSAVFRKVFKTITVDNGCEFSDYKGIENSNNNQPRTTLYFCHPYSSYERGSNENQNRLIRRHYPKGFDFSNASSTNIKKLEKWINDYPREIFGWYSSSDLFNAYLNDITSA